MKKTTKILFFALFLLGFVFFLNPNPFGNQPMSLGDETYFLTTSVKAIQDHTLPGLISDPTAAYYGGVLTYPIFFAVALIGALLFATGMHASAIASWIAFHWGDLIHIGRLVNGLIVYVTLVWIGWHAFQLSKKLNKPSVAWFGFFAIALVCGSSVFVPLAHTSKIWPIYAAIELLTAWLILSQEWKKESGYPALEKKTYLNILITLNILSLCQVLLGSLTILWVLDALLLRHITWKNILEAFKRPFVWIALLIAAPLNYSFTVNFLAYVRQLVRPNNLSGNVITSAHPWIDRMIWPFQTLFTTQPILCILFICEIGLLLLYRKKFSEAKMRLLRVLAVHTALVYVIFYLLFGFGIETRYVLPLTLIAATFVAAAFMDFLPWRKTIAAVCALLAVGVLFKTAILFWQPSSVARLQEALSRTAIFPHALLITSAHFQPAVLNEQSIQFTKQYSITPIFRRYTLLASDSSYADLAAPYTISVGMPQHAPSSGFDSIWLIDEQGGDTCADAQETCIQINVPEHLLTTDWVAEGADIVSLFKTNMIGHAYTLKKVNAMPSR